ncbi:MAG TPA: hypothetical protein VFW78_10515 [Bacteroidia bacterium]|nr:hypothetical protein [Bacteroidia bacterium]
MIYSILLTLHVIAGSAALLGGLVAIVAKKARGVHTNAGKVYYIGMYGVAFSAVVMTLIKFNPFLLAVGIFAFYLTYTGKSAITNYRRKAPWEFKPSAVVPGYAGLAVALFMIGWPIAEMILSHRLFVPILSVFGFILLLNTIQDIRFLSNPLNRVARNRQFLLLHIGKMGGAYIATTTAFLLNNFTFNPAWIGWLLPTIIGSPLIARAIRIWRNKLKLA